MKGHSQWKIDYLRQILKILNNILIWIKKKDLRRQHRLPSLKACDLTYIYVYAMEFVEDRDPYIMLRHPPSLVAA